MAPHHKKLLALIITLAVTLRLALSIAHPFNFPDSQDYDALARALLAEKPYQLNSGGDVLIASRMPGYPIFVAAIYLLSNSSQLAVLITQSLLSAITILLVYKITQKLFTPSSSTSVLSVSSVRNKTPTQNRIALLAALLAALDPLSIAFTATLLSESLFTLTLLLALYLAIRLIEGAPFFNWILLGLVWSVAVYLRASSFWSLIPISLLAKSTANPTPIFVAGRRQDSGIMRRHLGGCAAALALVLCALLPWQARNFSYFHSKFFRLTTLEGISLYEAVYPDADGGPKQDLIQLPPEMMFMNEAERNDEWSRRGWYYVFTDPARILKLAATKVARTWSPTLNAADFQNPKIQLALALWHIPLFILAIIGVFFAHMSIKIKWLLLTPILYFTLVHALFLGSVRYRVPLMPLVCIFATTGLAVLLKWEFCLKPPPTETV